MFFWRYNILLHVPYRGCSLCNATVKRKTMIKEFSTATYESLKFAFSLPSDHKRVYCTLRSNATVQLNATIFPSTYTYILGRPFPSPLTTKGFPFTVPSICSLIFMKSLTIFCGVKVRLIRKLLPVSLTRSRKVKSSVKN